MSNASFSVGTTFEIGRVPARTLELKSGCGKLLGEIFCLALRAGAELRLADLLHDVFLKAATGAAISIDRHGNLQILVSWRL